MDLTEVFAASIVGSTLATAHRRGGSAGIAVFQLPLPTDGKPARFIATPELDGGPDKLAVSPDGKIIVVSGKHGSSVLVLDADSGTVLGHAARPSARVAKIDWSADGKVFVVAGEDYMTPPPGAADSAVGGKMIAFVSPGRAMVFAGQPPYALSCTLEGPSAEVVDVVAAPAGGVTVAFKTGEILQWTIADGQVVGSGKIDGKPGALAAAPGGAAFALALKGERAAVVIMDAAFKSTARIEGSPSFPTQASFDATGRRLAITGFDVVSVWDVVTRKRLGSADYSAKGGGGGPAAAGFVDEDLVVAGGERRIAAQFGGRGLKASIIIGPSKP